MNFKKGDEVVIISGVDKGKTAKVVTVIKKSNKVVLEGEGIKTCKHHEKPSQSNPDGGIIEKACPIDASNVMIVTGKDKKRTRIGYEVVTEAKSKKKDAPVVTRKVRVAKKGGAKLD